MTELASTRVTSPEQTLDNLRINIIEAAVEHVEELYDRDHPLRVAVDQYHSLLRAQHQRNDR